MKRAIVAALATMTIAAYAGEWFEVASNDEFLFEGKANSIKIGKNNGGDEVVAVVGRATKKKDSSTETTIWYVKTEDCKKDTGTLFITTMNGEYVNETDYKIGENKIAAVIASGICEGRKIIEKSRKNLTI